MNHPSDYPAHPEPHWPLPVFIFSTVAALIVIGAVVAGILYWTDAAAPSKDLMQTSSSPGGRWVVEVYDINPGVPGHETFSVEARLATGGHKRQILLIDPERPPYTDLKWASNNHLVIQWQTSTSLTVGGAAVSITE